MARPRGASQERRWRLPQFTKTAESLGLKTKGELKAQKIGGKWVCDECGKAFEMTSIQMHHKNPGFESILQGFLNLKQIELHSVPVISLDGLSIIADRYLLGDFQTYHRDRAVMIALCKQCHRKRKLA